MLFADWLIRQLLLKSEF